MLALPLALYIEAGESQIYTSLMYVDPGLATGWATWDADGARFSAGITDPEETFDFVERFANQHAGERVLIGCETFTITPATGKKAQAEMHWPLEIIGVCRYLAWRNQLTFECVQSPAAAKRFGTDAKLRSVGMYTAGKEDHARDASRHLLLKLSKLRLIRIP